MERLNMQTDNLANEKFKLLEKFFPNAITESIDENGNTVRAVDADVLKQEISCAVVEGKEERYQFTWPDKKKAILLSNAPITSTLRPCEAESVDFEHTQNLYIEGDNLDVMKVLHETYLGKVKMIYIDPPYNTGSDLVYNDDFSDNLSDYIEKSGQLDEKGNQLVENLESNGRFHTDWLNMIYPRLKIARDLLSDDGVIFISLDDNEIVNLKKVCDEIFSASNFVGQITVVGNPRGRDYGGVARMHDYVLVYKKSPLAQLNLIEDPDNEFSMKDELGGFELRELRNRNIKFNKENRPNLYYPFYIDTENEDKYHLHPISLEPHDGWLELYPLESQGINTVWRWGKPKSLENLNINICAKPMRNGSYMIVEKYRESRMMARSVWWDKDTNTEKGTLLVKDMLDGKVFDYPKPVEMLMRMCEMGTDSENEDIVMDFFSGSASMAHAVMKLNARDGGNRRFIMVQLPENVDENSVAYKSGYSNICEIGKERIRRAPSYIEKEFDIQKLDVGFRCFKLASSNMKDIYYNPAEIQQTSLFGMADNIKEDRTSEDLLFQVMLDLGVILSSKIEKRNIAGKMVYIVSDGFLMACFDSDVTEDVVKAIAEEKPYYAVFRDSSMASDSVATNFDQIFASISPDTVRKVL